MIMAKATIVDHSIVKGVSRGHEILFDAPEFRGGQDAGIEQPEGLLASLAACYLEWVRRHAEKFGIELIDAEVICEGELAISRDMKWEMGYRTGFKNIKTTYNVKANNSDEEVKNFIQLMNELCIVGSTLHYPPTLDYEVNILDN